MKDKKNNYRWFLIGILTVLLLMVVAMIWDFTSQSGPVSHTMSKAIAEKIQKRFAENFVIKPTDFFWSHNLEELVRKVGHFSEYMLLGLLLCSLMNILWRRVWLTVAISLIICPIYAYIDEYRQNFVLGRTPRWFDWKIDVAGAILGIVVVTIVFLIIRYVQKLKARISKLEEQR